MLFLYLFVAKYVSFIFAKDSLFWKQSVLWTLTLMSPGNEWFRCAVCRLVIPSFIWAACLFPQPCLPWTLLGSTCSFPSPVWSGCPAPGALTWLPQAIKEICCHFTSVYKQESLRGSHLPLVQLLCSVPPPEIPETRGQWIARQQYLGFESWCFLKVCLFLKYMWLSILLSKITHFQYKMVPGK